MGALLMGLGGIALVIGLVTILAGIGAGYYIGDIERMYRIMLGAGLAGSGLGVLALGYLISAVDAIRQGIERMSPPPQQVASDGTPIKKESWL